MKNKLMEALKTKFQGVDDAILDRIATKRGNALTDEAEIPALVEGIGFQDVLTSYGDFRAGDASVKAVSGYEKKWSLKDGKTIESNEEGGSQANPNPTDLSAQITAAVAAAVKPLSEKLSVFESAERNKSFVQGVRESLKNVDESFYELADRNFESQEAADAFVTQTQGRWKAFTEKHASQGLDFKVPGKSDGGKGDDVDSLVNVIEQGTKDATDKKS